MRLEYHQVLKLRKGPFNAHANRSVLQGAALEMGKMLEQNNIIFQTLCEDIVESSTSLKKLPGVGPEEHIKKYWELCCKRLQEKRTGLTVRTSWW